MVKLSPNKKCLWHQQAALSAVNASGPGFFFVNFIIFIGRTALT
ncbi:MAG: hypothetical protein ACI93R_003567 [Flavobacteriales bacterium]|jgi:hypothetical protein